MLIGACGETKEDFQDVLKVCARMAVGRGDAVYMYVSPIFEAEVKDEAYCICHLTPLSSSDCRCHCPRSLPLHVHKRSRLQFVQDSRGEAATCMQLAARVAEEIKNHENMRSQHEKHKIVCTTDCKKYYIASNTSSLSYSHL